MDNKIIDGMKKEGKIFLGLAIFATILFALTFIYMYVNERNFQDKVLLSMLIVYSMFFCLAYMDGYILLNIELSLIIKEFI